jgi:16S rRNA (uracil1498-N3)-methyltransferase
MGRLEDAPAPALRIVRVITDLPAGVETGARVRLTSEDSHHLQRVLRMRSGEPFQLCNGHGREWQAVLGDPVERRPVVLEALLQKELPAMPEPSLQIELCVAVARGDRVERLIEKAAELGVHRFTPVLTERTTVERSGDERLARWTRLARESSALAGRSHALQVGSPLAFTEVVSSRTGWILTGGAARWDVCLSGRTTLLVGPEGGFSAGEIDLARAGGWTAASLGPRTLRVETATVAAVTLALWGSGDL